MADGPATLQARTSDHITWLTLARPARLNAFTVADYRDLRVALEHAMADPETRVIVLTGAGRAFSAGADRSLLDATSNAAGREAAGAEFARLLEALRTCEKPLLAAVNGLAVGFGVTLLLYFDLVLAAESARFRLPFTALGMVPEAGSTALLPARTRPDEAMWAVLSSEWIGSRAARDMGLVWQVVADASLVEQTGATAAVIAAQDPAAVMATKRLMTAGRADAARAAIDRELGEQARLNQTPRTGTPVGG
ncbi:Enoyl-CoA hydratase/carnithine racemase [Parafrankia irregularis]|uniref:Enoyl-CoA hydratase/carnithine racemase n=1 Tax=Parafrankia irregularis TaxID=795642 RepID=A0A0S4QGZ7_9ACTN|nr:MULTISPECIES: enoyl-CoA hydratase/isomerase family protein [Parafrankia]MBE3200763.1 enoyl-CoA hydratase/isomerase family protein [Parafrankia sp. CH37]CUU54849.1 Enoyl-CoA hydratase/carnithine racemase [Parafrankia irregularis]